MFRALHTTLTLDDALDLIEIADVGRSWRDAEAHNADEIGLELARRNRRESP